MMRSFVRVSLLAVILLLTGAAVVAAQGTETDPTFTDVDQSVLVGVRSDVSLPADQAADAVVVVQGAGEVLGTTRALVMIDGEVTVGSGAVVEDLFALGGTLTIEAGAQVEDLGYIDTVVDAAPGTVTNVRDIPADVSGAFAWIAAALAIAVLAIWIGAGIFTLVSGLALVAFGTSQARRAAWLIGNHPLKVLLAGFLAAVLPWILIALLAVTIIGIPLAFGLLLFWVFAFFLGYLVAGLWVGERLVRSSRMKDRPYAAMFVGVLVLLLLSWIPFVTLIATWFGLGAVTMAGWRVLRNGGRPAAAPAYGQPYGQPPYGYVPQPTYAPPPYSPPYAPPAKQWPPQDRWPPQQPPASWPG